VDTCPDRILELDEVTGNLIPAQNAWEMATYTEDLKERQEMMKKRPEDEDFVTVLPSTDRFIFSVESTGAMDAEDILLSSLRVLKDRLNYLAAEVEKLKD
jgi:DNA-directed RNA polymerase II subunit RPB3